MAKIYILQKAFVERVKNLIRYLIPPFILHSAMFALFRNWLFQGTVLMDRFELLFRIFLEVILFLVISWPLWFFCKNIAIFIYCFIFVHTLTWLFNGHFWALHIGGRKRLVRNTPQKIINYLYGLEERLKLSDSISGCIIFGSLARGKFHEYSDLDIVLSREDGIFVALCAYSLGVRERVLAFIYKIPIEIYFYDPKDLANIEPDEKPLIIKDTNGKWKEKCPEAVWLSYFKPLSEGFFRF